MLSPVYLDDIFYSVVESSENSTAEDLLQAIAADRKLIDALRQAMDRQLPDEDDTGPTRVQCLREVVLSVLST